MANGTGVGYSGYPSLSTPPPPSQKNTGAMEYYVFKTEKYYLTVNGSIETVLKMIKGTFVQIVSEVSPTRWVKLETD